ncbi:Carcinine transporter [Nymphon striatum]|nr:Carcinine transporter [Nymphon striatum]
MFRSRKGDISSGQLPPCKDALKQQTNRANYQAAIWRRSLQNSPEIPSPTNGHGWNVVEGKLGLTGAPAPDVVLELMSCKCPRRCNENCPCVVNGFSCTPACKLLDCHNMQEEDEGKLTNASVPMILYGFLATTSGALGLLLPETRSKRLPNTIEEGEAFGKHETFDLKKMCSCCQKPNKCEKDLSLQDVAVH